jgi:hypothetical protein
VTRRRRRRVPWPVTAVALPATLATVAWLLAETVRLVGVR